MKIKKILFFMIILLGIILLSNVSNASVGSEFTYNNIKYKVLTEEVNNYTAEVSGYEGNLREVTIPQTVLSAANTYTVTEIGENAFRNNFSLKSITIPNTVTIIKKSAFEKCEAMENIEMSTALTTIGEYAFCDCKSLTSIIIPNSVEVIKELAFSYATSLENVTLSNSLTTIEHGVFQDCSALTRMTIPASVTLIGNDVFAWCPKLQEINVVTGNTEYCSVDGVLFNYDKTKLICYPASKVGKSYIIPSSVFSIESFAFKACNLLEEIYIPNSVTTIKSSAFDECTSLTNITIPDSVTTIEPYTFVWCTNLNRINIPDSVTTIVDDSAFWGCDYLTFFCNDNSYAKEYAQNNNINCKPLYYYSVINNVSNVSFNGPFYAHQKEGNYSTNLKENIGYKLPTEITVKVGNKALNNTEYEYDNSTGKLIIPVLNITGDITIEGSGIGIYKVVFDANEGFFTENRTQYIIEDWEIGDEKTLEEPTRDGYKFIGFYTEEIGGTSLENYINESGIDGNLTFYAQWEELTKIELFEMSKNQNFIIGENNNLIFYLNSDRYTGKVFINNEELSNKNYTWNFAEGIYPTIILSEEYMKLLEQGEFNIKFLLDDGRMTETIFTVFEKTEDDIEKDTNNNNTEKNEDTTINNENNNIENPQTGDSVVLLVTILLVSIIGIFFTTKIILNCYDK